VQAERACALPRAASLAEADPPAAACLAVAGGLLVAACTRARRTVLRCAARPRLIPALLSTRGWRVALAVWDAPGAAGAGGAGVRQAGPAAGGTSWATRRPCAWRRRCWSRPRGCRWRSRRAAGASRSAAPVASASRRWRPRPRQRRARPAPQTSRARKLAACPGRAGARRCAGSRLRTPRAWYRSAACRPRPRWPAWAPTASCCYGRRPAARCATAGAWPARRRARPSAPGARPCSNTWERLRRMQAAPICRCTACEQGSRQAAEVTFQSRLPRVLTHAREPSRCMAASAATSWLAAGSRAGVLRLVQAAAPGLPVVARVRLFAGPVAALAWGPGAQLLAAVSGDARRGPALNVLRLLCTRSLCIIASMADRRSFTAHIVPAAWLRVARACLERAMSRGRRAGCGSWPGRAPPWQRRARSRSLGAARWRSRGLAPRARRSCWPSATAASPQPSRQRRRQVGEPAPLGACKRRSRKRSSAPAARLRMPKAL
jgi:hypothetical protein